ncbi:proton-conducting transporter membrane subunit [Plantactinospora sp. WMMC1484]|uniref:proton-conducting transporter transmembrane domain-containing protein n=1 Tax=Plantactinospora sp. WMMC1484 TaxID=3404122 RepID=UPI003BF53B32
MSTPWEVLVPLPVVLPLLGAGLGLLLGRSAMLRVLSVLILAADVAVAGALLVRADGSGPVGVAAGGWSAPLGIALVADRLAALLLLTSSLVLLAVLVYAMAERSLTGGQEAVEPRVFHPGYLGLAAGVNLAFLSADLFNLFVAVELTLAASYVLMTLGPTPPRVRAGMTYLVVSLTSSILFVTAVAICYAATGTLSLAQLGQRLPQLPEGLQTSLALLLFVVFGIKAAVVPLHMWLPDSYPTALAPITAVFAALLTKVAVYALVRTQTLISPAGAPSRLVLGFALATLLVGLFGALVQRDLNRLLSLVLVGHIGYLLFGLGLDTAAGLRGAILYMLHHIVALATLFMAAGMVRLAAGSARLDKVRGLSHTAPVIAVLFLVPALSVSGVPPFSGFVAKLALVQAGVAAGRPEAYLLVGTGVFVSLLTLLAMSRVWMRMFWGEPGPAGDPPVPGLGRAGQSAPATLMAATTAGVLVAGLALAVLAGPLSEIAGRAAADLLDPTAYRAATLGTGVAP